jgi:hypothetical protein
MAGVDAFIRRYRELPSGYYREFAPSIDLRDYIACGWIKAVRGEPALIPIVRRSALVAQTRQEYRRSQGLVPPT